jgi:hypothetical protein
MQNTVKFPEVCLSLTNDKIIIFLPRQCCLINSNGGLKFWYKFPIFQNILFLLRRCYKECFSIVWLERIKEGQ